MLRSGIYYRPHSLSTIIEEVVPQNISKNFTSEINQTVEKITMAFSQAMGIVPNYSGSPQDLSKFLRCCKIAQDLFKATDKPTFMELMEIKLQDKAYEVIKYKDFTDFEELKLELVKQFREKRTYEQIHTELVNIKQGQQENCLDYGNRVERLLADLNEASMARLGSTAETTTKLEIKKMNSGIALEAFTLNLRHPYRTIIRASRFSELSEAIKSAINEERYAAPNPSYPSKTQYQAPRPIRSFNGPMQISPRCHKCNKIGHYATQCKTNIESQIPKTEIKTERLFCVYCKKNNHTIQKCRILEAKRKPKQVNLINTQTAENFQGPHSSTGVAAQSLQNGTQ